MANTVAMSVAKLLQTEPWDDDEWFAHYFKVERDQDYSYWLRGDFIALSAPLNLQRVIEVGAVPASISARAVARIEAYQGADGSLVLADLKGPRELGVAFHPCTTAPGKIQATYFDKLGFSGHLVFPSLQKAVEAFPTYIWDGRELLAAAFPSLAA